MKNEKDPRQYDRARWLNHVPEWVQWFGLGTAVGVFLTALALAL